jgi:hypothetical protein
MSAWRKSTFSGSNSDCVEVEWRKSSFSGTNSDCVEVSVSPDRVGLRDSKNPDGPRLSVPSEAWTTLLVSL